MMDAMTDSKAQMQRGDKEDEKTEPHVPDHQGICEKSNEPGYAEQDIDEDEHESFETNSVDEEEPKAGIDEHSAEFDMMEEPELEFDEVGVELSAQDAEIEAEEGIEHGYLHNLHVHTSELNKSKELAREEKEHPFGSGAITPDGFIEEDFEEELGSPLQEDEDDDDPNVEFRDIAKFGIIEVAGDDIFGRKVIVCSACRLPPHHELDHDRFLQYLRFTLDQYVENDYTLVYFHYGLNSRNKPSFAWLRQAYKEFDRKYKKNLKAMYVVHPTNFIRIMWNIFRPFISIKFGKKVMYVNYLHELAHYVQLDQLRIPQRVKDYDAFLLAKNKPQPVPTSIIHAPLPTQQFGVTLEYIREHNNGEVIPPVVEQCVEYIKKHGMETEGIFRRSASAVVLREVQKKFNAGMTVDFEELGDVHIPAAILKSFMRQLPEPLLPYDLYDHIIRVQSLDSDEKEFEMRRLLIDELAEDNYYVLKYIIGFLTEVASYSTVNKMTTKNLAIVFGPNLMWSKSQASLTSLGYVNACAEYLIMMFEDLFVK